MRWVLPSPAPRVPRRTTASAVGQVGVSAIQLMTHFVNEYYDAPRDALVAIRTLFSGGSGVLRPEG